MRVTLRAATNLLAEVIYDCLEYAQAHGFSTAPATADSGRAKESRPIFCRNLNPRQPLIAVAAAFIFVVPGCGLRAGQMQRTKKQGSEKTGSTGF